MGYATQLQKVKDHLDKALKDKRITPAIRAHLNAAMEHLPWKDEGYDKKLAARYVEAAGNIHTDEGTIEVDDDAIVSFGGDGGAYVQAWVWVSASTVFEDDTYKKMPAECVVCDGDMDPENTLEDGSWVCPDLKCQHTHKKAA